MCAALRCYCAATALGWPLPPPPPLPPPGPEPEPRGRHLREFLELLLAKNHGAMRHIPPPGLSDQTALASAAFALLRLMNEQVLPMVAG